jgi:crotonobetainyl-CoA:carnitine CoA-transferase CaiB-like acyl-CoA transferase
MPLGGEAPCYGLYRTKDGERVALGALEPKFWAAFCEAVGHSDWIGRAFDPSLRKELETLFARRTLPHWVALSEEVDCCLEPVRDLESAAVPLAQLQPVRFNGERPAATGPAPEQGADTENILRGMGVPLKAIAIMRRKGAINVN